MRPFCVATFGALAILTGCHDPDLYYCNRPEMCSHAADARNQADQAAQQAAEAAQIEQQTQEYEATRPQRDAEQKAADAAYKKWLASLTPDQRAEYYYRLRQRSLEIQRYHELLDLRSSLTGRGTICSGRYCW